MPSLKKKNAAYDDQYNGDSDMYRYNFREKYSAYDAKNRNGD